MSAQAPAAAPAAPPAAEDAHRPKVTLITPCLNEELVVGEFVEWCKTGLEQAGVDGEIVIVDSSTDRSPEIAAEHGARVLSFPKRGLGQAYIDAIPHLRGDYVIMGDCDLTYDFREIRPFVEKLDEGYEFVMGSRFRGSIEPGAMPKLHQYFGTPLTTWILNRMYGTRYSDIHCGMRGMTREALDRIQIESSSWEYASEMILKATKLRLRTTEVPVRFYKDREGRVSHHKRMGWMSPWIAGWQNLRIMFLYAPEFFLRWPGLIMFFLGFALTASIAGGPWSIGGLGIDLHWMLLGITLSALGYSAVQLWIIATVHRGFDPAFTRRVLRLLPFDRGVLIATVLVLAGIGLNGALLARWLSDGFGLDSTYFPGVFGLLLIIVGFQTFVFTLLLHIVVGPRRRQTEA